MYLEKLSKELRKYSNVVKFHPDHLFRGQARSCWGLEPSFSRLANKRKLCRTKALQLERECVNKFSISASKLLPLRDSLDLTLARFTPSDGKGIDFLGWFVMMQHYSAPTRKLDWSCSPWVALYFACCEEKDNDGTLWIADFNKVTEYGNKKLGKLEFVDLMIGKNSKDILVFSMAFNTNERIEAQQGRFSICTNPLVDHKNLMQECDGISKIEIPKKAKSEIMEELYRMNITAKTLFPGVDGLGKSIYEYIDLWDDSSVIT